ACLLACLLAKNYVVDFGKVKQNVHFYENFLKKSGGMKTRPLYPCREPCHVIFFKKFGCRVKFCCTLRRFAGKH
ncbi:MAG: hypothetical protein LBU43_03795, partial [Candidatus Accumulibacter sp.]|nr:hypothetical protein [Accumulibacter sp.]